MILLEIFLDQDNKPTIIKSEEFMSRIYSAILKVKSTVTAEDIFRDAFKLLNERCSGKIKYSDLLVDMCILQILHTRGLYTVAMLYMSPNMDNEVTKVLGIKWDDVYSIIWD